MKITAMSILDPEKMMEFDGNDWLIEFGDGRGRLHVATASDGKIDVRSPRGSPIKIEPRAVNSVWVGVMT